MRIGERVELKDRREAGVIVATVEQHGRVTSVRVRLDRSGRVKTVDPSRVEVE